MALREIKTALEEVGEAANDLLDIDFNTGTEPSDSADADTWREYALGLLAIIEDAEKKTQSAAALLQS